MQKRKLTLDELKVESFVTSISSTEKATVNGGIEVAALNTGNGNAVLIAAEDSIDVIIRSLISECPQTTRNPKATPCPGTWTENCPGGPTLLGPLCPAAQ
jgi:hypothetical protein